MRRRPIETADARSALRALLYDHVREVSGGNRWVSLREAPGLHPWVRRWERAMRDEGGPGVWVDADILVQRSLIEGIRVWDRFNPPDKPRDHRYLAIIEQKQIAEAEPDLGELTARAVQRVRAGEAPTVEQLTEYFTNVDFGQGAIHAESIPDARRVNPGQERHIVPAGVLAAFDFYHRLEAAGGVEVSLHSGRVAGKPV